MAALQVAVLVPRLKAAGGVIELHEPDAALHQAARQQALPAEDVGGLTVDAVEPPGRLGFALLQVKGIGGLALHAKGQLERLDPALKRLSSGRPSRCSSFKRRRTSSSRALALGADAIVLEVADRVLQVGDERSLVGGRQKPCAVLPCPFDQRAGADGDEPGQVLVLGAQAVGDPGAQAGAGGHSLAGVHQQAAAGVVDVVADHRADHAQGISAGGRRAETAH